MRLIRLIFNLIDSNLIFEGDWSDVWHLELQIFGPYLLPLCCLGLWRGRCAVGVCGQGAHGFSQSPMGLLSQAVHAKNNPAVCIKLRCTHDYTHALNLIVKKFLSISAVTTNVRWAVSTPKGAAWTPVITCLRSSGTLAARWSLSTSRPQV